VTSGPTIVGSSTIESTQTKLTAGKLSQTTVQSRDTFGTPLSNTDDLYSMQFTGPTGGAFSVAGIYLDKGLYQLQYVPRVAGNYIVHITLLGVDIKGSPYNVVVMPGETSSSNSFTTVTNLALTQFEAGVTYLFQLQLVDIFNNYLVDGSQNDFIEVMALYQNNAAWPSPISIPDLANWQSIYGVDIAGLCSNNNNGVYNCQLTTYRAGLYTMSVKVNGLHVFNSPWSPVNVSPTDLYAPSCVPKGIPVTMVAGTQYTFQI